MGNCASPQTTVRRISQTGSTAKVIHVDGRMQEFKQPIRAEHVIAKNPNCFLCSSESMHLDSLVPHVGENEELQLGQIYFLLPLKISQIPLSLPDLCALAIKAGAALAEPSFSGVRCRPTGYKIPAASQGVVFGGSGRRNQGIIKP